VVVLTLKEVLARIPSNEIVYSILLNELLSLCCAMNQVSEISSSNLSTYAYSLNFNLIGDYSLDDNFLVDHICITCDRINELTLAVFSPICYVSQSFCCGTLDYVCDNMKIHSSLVDIFRPANVLLSMLDCCNLAGIASDLSYSLCLSQHVLPSCAMDLYFIDLRKIGCILDVVCNYLDHIYVSSIYQSSATEA
jgi:hypothetical protein